MHFEPVWVSSVEHLAAFQNIYGSTSWLGRVLGRYKMSADFPCIQLRQGIVPHRIPIIMFAQGQLDIDGKIIRFQSVDWAPPAGERLNLTLNWDFELKANEIRSVENFEQASPVLRYYNMKFTRLVTTHPAPVNDVLFCVGGTGFTMKTMRERSEELQQELLKFG